MTKPSNIESIENATQKKWIEWTAFLDQAGAKTLDHPAIAEIVRLELEGNTESPGWWAQNITVAYEQHIGRRKPGQQNDGSFQTSVTKLIAGTKEDVFALWQEAYAEVRTFNGQDATQIRTSITPVRIYWRCELADGSKVTISTEDKSPGKAMIAATHTKLGSETARDEWRIIWKNALESL